jgi:polyribonucleotide nucleotidyltransferase
MASKIFVKDFFFVASNEHAAEVIGSNGWKVKSIAMRTGTQIKCPSPEDPPIFSITGLKPNVESAKKMIQSWANHFDVMKSKKRTIRLDPGEVIDTVIFTSLDVACIIGRKGKQVKNIAGLANVKIISPDVNKEPVFIVSGRQENIELAIFWMKLTTFSSTGTNYFNDREISQINQILNDDKSTRKTTTIKATERIIDLRRFRTNFNLRQSEKFDHYMTKNSWKSPYNCCYCKQKKTRVAKAFCGHVISCDVCIAELFQNIHLKCYFCKVKIENFLIEIYGVK